MTLSDERDDAVINALQRKVAERQATSLPQLIVGELERMIITGALSGGDRINESALALRLGVSRGPIREACRQLERDRLVEFRTNRGMFVREISLSEAAALYDVRAGLFRTAGRLAAERASADRIDELRSRVAQLAAAVPDVDDYYPGNVDLHRALVALAENPRLAELYDSVSKELHLFRRHGLETTAAREVSNGQHAAIIEALAAGDIAATARLMEEHILSGKQRMLAAAGE
ncbi:FCD domain-containing protein [Nocardia pseudobrasiliensis]|uniref:DNA-binding GntR family transcriptional regulator n=1 Tax=Nocardia pseudobrasiliensis TaxID=45979 RepID=A0A370I8N1_9NOCA|nr:FCD domain-containing protein [Nocardia pseudobrasiliensis]RDI67073.1 DNA-binding GntR family transcriptional regulator [Nocardia pseudobrasiliensis]